MATTVREHVRVSNAPVKCIGCGGRIWPGETYRTTVLVQSDWTNSDFVLLRMHTDCIPFKELTEGLWRLTL